MMKASAERRKQSIFSLIFSRQHGLCPSNCFERGVFRFFETKELLDDPEIISPHRRAITSLSIDRNGGRFLLAGSFDGTLSIYDLSKWGSEHFVRCTQRSGDPKARRTAFHPVAQSVKVPATSDVLEVPAGHSSSITHVQWYPVDTGAFISSASDGSILLWDTNRMEPVLRVKPFEDSGMGSAHLQTGGDRSLIATGSWYESTIKLVDLRSGSHSHQLMGHEKGITALQWSPTMPAILASGSRDGSIRLWDIRKSGSQSCISIFNREASSTGFPKKPYKGDYSHLRISAKKTAKGKSRRKETFRIAPNNYSHLQSTGLRCHNGNVGALAFLPGGQSLASVGGLDGELLLWDLRHGRIVPNKFVAPGGMHAATPKRKQSSLCVDPTGSTLWVGNQANLLGFSVEGGSPTQILRGHLHNITSVDMEPGKMVTSGSQDGMILCWGKPKVARRNSSQPVLQEDRDNW